VEIEKKPKKEKSRKELKKEIILFSMKEINLDSSFGIGGKLILTCVQKQLEERKTNKHITEKEKKEKKKRKGKHREKKKERRNEKKTSIN